MAGWFVALPFVFACAWTIPEIIRGTAMTGLPILSLGYQMVGTAFFGYAPIVGLYGVGFAAALASALFGMLAFVKRRRTSPSPRTALGCQQRRQSEKASCGAVA